MSYSNNSSMPQLQQAVLITGATSGIGLALADYLAEQGYLVVVNSRNRLDCEALAKRLVGVPLAFDVTDEASLKDAFKTLNIRLKEKQAVLYSLVHCAGSMVTQPLHFTQHQTLQKMLDEHLVSGFLLSQWASKLMMREQQGSIVFLSSVVAQQGSIGQVAYASAKAGVEGMTRSLAKELGAYGIRVNAVAPGVVETPLIKDLSDDRRSEIVNATLLKRLGQPGDIAQVLAFLLSQSASFMTGQTLAVDGGLHLS